MGHYSCPSCDELLPPRGDGHGLSDGSELRGPRGMPLERRRCPACGECLERELLGHWLRAGSLAATAELEPAESLY